MEEIIRQELDTIAKRAMCVLKPIKVIITGGYDASSSDLNVPDFPQKDESSSHSLKLTQTFYMDASDFKTEDVEGYYGLAPNKWVGLKYAGCINCLNVSVLFMQKKKKVLLFEPFVLVQIFIFFFFFFFFVNSN
jgi:glutaminyl-tRNA synthetase